MFLLVFFFFFKQKTAYEMRISDWSSDVCSSDLYAPRADNAVFRYWRPSPRQTILRAPGQSGSATAGKRCHRRSRGSRDPDKRTNDRAAKEKAISAAGNCLSIRSEERRVGKE